MTEAVEENCKLESRAGRAKNVVLSKEGAGPRQYVDTMVMAPNQISRCDLDWMDLESRSWKSWYSIVASRRKALVFILEVLARKDGR